VLSDIGIQLDPEHWHLLRDNSRNQVWTGHSCGRS